MTTYVLPEPHAADQIADLIEPWVQPHWLTREALHAICCKVVARRSAVRSIFDELDAGPTIDTPKILLRQQATASLDDQDALLEELAILRRQQADIENALRSIGSPYVDRFDPDSRDADRADDQARERAQDERASREGVRL